MNVLSEDCKTTIKTLLERGLSHREIARVTGRHRSAIRKVAEAEAKRTTPSTGFEGGGSQNVPPCRPALMPESQSAPYREWIEAQVDLGRNAMSIYQDLVEMHGFCHKYSSVQRFVKGLKRRNPERFDFLEYGPGEEAQVDYGEGALTLLPNGKWKKPYLFVMTLKYSGKAFRKVVWKTSQEIWAKLHEEAFRAFGGCTRYVMLDNLKEGVIKPDLYEPELNKVYAAVMAHYGVVAQPCRVRDPNRKGSVERAIQHTQDTALKGKRFDTIEKQNEWLAHWEERWAAPRIHGRKKRQVQAMYLEEKPHLLPLPAAGFRSFVEEERKVDDSGMVQVKGSYYSAPAALIYLSVRVRITERKFLKDIDWSYNPKLPKGECLELGALKFIDAKEDILLVGQPGTAKSHIAKALALLAVERGYRVIYRDANDFIGGILEARELGTWKKHRSDLVGADLLVIDDLFLRRLPQGAGDELADIIMSRYEHHATIITSNRPFDDWAKLLGDVVVVAPLLDRLLHHGHLLRFEGKSWRLKEAAQRQIRTHSEAA